MIKGLKCISCGGALEPAEGASICKCEKCGTVQPVPAQIPEEKAAEETPETAYLEACAMEEAAADSAALAAAAETFDKAGNWRDAAERAADCRRKAEAAKEAEKAASFQRWLKERGER
jgi:DNA-directed RNA polymerase subunit M/transcription elongation factor TFIIS